MSDEELDGLQMDWSRWDESVRPPITELSVSPEQLFQIFESEKFQSALIKCREAVQQAKRERGTPTDGSFWESGFEVFLDAQGETLIPCVRLGNEDTMRFAQSYLTLDGEELIADRQPLVSLHSHNDETTTDEPIVPSPPDLLGNLSALNGVIHFTEQGGYSILLYRLSGSPPDDQAIEQYMAELNEAFRNKYRTQSLFSACVEQAGFSVTFLDFAAAEDGLHLEVDNPESPVYENLVIETH